MNVPIISLAYVIPFSLLLVILSLRVLILRAKNKIAFATCGIEKLEKAVRAQANLCEYLHG